MGRAGGTGPEVGQRALVVPLPHWPVQDGCRPNRANHQRRTNPPTTCMVGHATRAPLRRPPAAALGRPNHLVQGTHLRQPTVREATRPATPSGPPAEGLEAEVDPTSTAMRGWLPDQAALSGVPARVRLLGLELIERRQLPRSG
jgi:hypothetical protein